MQRRSTARTTPRKKYTVDAFEGVPELADVVGDEDEDAAVADEPGDVEEVDEDALELDEASDSDELNQENEDDEDDEVSETDEVDDEVNEGAPLEPDELRTETRAHRIRQDRDTSHVTAAKRLWARDLTLPSRQKDSEGYGGFHHNFASGDEAREQRALDGWKWYVDSGGKEAFAAHQKLEIVTAEEAVQYLGAPQACGFVMGPIDEQKLFHLEPRQSIGLGTIWRDASPQGSGMDSEVPPGTRSGFIVNLGARVRSLEWVPSQITEYQYLSIIVGEDANDGLNAYSQGAPGDKDLRCAVQIWGLMNDTNGRIDNAMQPSLVLVLCLPFASIHTIRWCPIPCPAATETLGLLAIVPGDSKLRIVDVTSIESGDTVEYRLLRDTSFQMSVKDSLCTCVSWMSPTCIAVGYSDGNVRIWDLDRVTLTSPGGSQPIVTIRAHNSYVASILATSLLSPAVLVTAGIDGRIKHISLEGEKPKTTSVKVQKNNLTMPSLIYHEFLDRMLSFGDDNIVQSYTVTAFSQSSKAIANVGGLITTIATSPCHPYILIGTANGEVLTTNPLQDGLRSRQGPWQQMWFQHEWRRPKGDEVSAGLSRILEGFKSEHVPVSRSTGFVLAEEKTAITAIAWNPDIRCGGWAAVGMGGGLVRIEDIAQ
ncbi:hypothetical protein LTR78_007071 [Recurvomyces mirabilis]|uniref:Transcription factor TFIIIC complex subunit Tfc6 n=1 Tax=Recurvomyces mirabilis TaxID=574656 RepID=A0AAE1BYR9_9PEZI|nr:hypothetical protein LTR78_007071 [Recurvomyces mirabilis]KAK5150957.1 hypothetical protein LTS14_009761 [Recurvomyces mirabilis]